MIRRKKQKILKIYKFKKPGFYTKKDKKNPKIQKIKGKICLIVWSDRKPKKRDNELNGDPPGF